MKSAAFQFARYATVGLISNLLGYLLYLLITYLGIGPKIAMTLLYILGVLQTFLFNKKWSFRFAGAPAPALTRYVIAYASGYVVNFIALVILVDQAGLKHQIVQAALIVIVAMMMFLAQRYWVFPHTQERDSA